MALSDNLISAWEMTEASGTRADSHGSNDLSDNNTVGSGTGQVNGTAADFENTNSEYLSHADNADLSTGDVDFTFEIWFRWESAGDHILIGKDTDTGREYTLDVISAGTLRWYFAGSGNGIVSWGSALTTGTWYQCVAWHDSVNNLIGVAVNAGTAVTAASIGPPDTGTEFNIGARRYPGFNGNFDGLIGPVRLWKRVLTGAERTELYNAGAGRTYAYITGGAGGAISGTCSLSFGSGASALVGAGALSGSAALVFDDGASALSGAGALAGAVALTFDDGASALTGAGGLAGAAALAFAGSATPEAPSGAVSGSAALLFGHGATTLTGAGQLAGSAALTLTTAGALVGAGALAGSAALTFALTATEGEAEDPGAPVCLTGADESQVALSGADESQVALSYDLTC